ncbi:MFS transporter [Amycolatopsis sp. 195334CR]|uniref:MFS transporter n=1 Tax=Amycolatopsis sp. 195334CR TaxID=2814588 RepID=UPI001A8FB34C|nr:MFS transporter [Amycolatopsis sp. 195334CR]MBN6037659.1 MFS transporter [Amycolatopsis sp. 195334CR]
MHRPAHRWLGLVAVSLGVALIVVDLTIVNVILAPVIEDLALSSAQAQWVQESYAIVFAALLLLTGRLADLHGARRVFGFGLAVFAATSLAVALAPTGELVIAARFLQGVGGALILPASLSLVNTAFPGPDRAKAFAVWGSTIGAAAALGPLLGGWLAGFSWRWAFGINLPLAALIALVAFAYLPATPRRSGRIGFTGAVLSAAGLGLIAFALIEGRSHGWLLITEPWLWSAGPSPALVALVLAALLLTVFLRGQAKLGDAALLDVRLFTIPSFRNGNAITLLVGIGEFGLLAVLPLWLQLTLGYTPLEAAWALAALALGSFAASGASFSMKSSPLTQVRLGLALEIGGLAALGLLASPETSWWPIVLALLGYGVGVGFATAQVTNVVLAEIPPERAGQSSGIQSVTRELGSALGIAVITTVFFSASGSLTGGQAMTDALAFAAYLCAALLAIALLTTTSLRTKTNA